MSSTLNKTARHGSSYLIMKVAAMIIGLVSFPIITRLLSIHDYGLLALANTTLLFLFALGKCGVPSAIIAKIAGQSNLSSIKLYRSGILTVAGTTLLICTAYLMLAFIINLFVDIPHVFYILPPIVFFRNILAVHQAWLRATEKIISSNLLTALVDIGSTIIVILSILYITPTVVTIFSAKLIFESTAIILILFPVIRSIFKKKERIDKTSIKSIISFGVPLVWLEISMIVMTFGDRYQIGYMMNAESVGLYSAAYNLAQYVQKMISQPLILAVYPIYNKLYAEKGPKETCIFLNKILYYYFIIAIPILIFISFQAHNILTLLASEKYAAAANIVPIILLASLLNGCIPLISAGLYVTKKTKTIGKITVLCALINFSLNWIFINIWGYAGAAFATLLSFISLFILTKKTADKRLKVNIQFTNCSMCLLMALCAIIPSFFFTNRGLSGIAFSGMFFVVIYSFFIIRWDKEISFHIKKILANIIHKNVFKQ